MKKKYSSLIFLTLLSCMPFMYAKEITSGEVAVSDILKTFPQSEADTSFNAKWSIGGAFITAATLGIYATWRTHKQYALHDEVKKDLDWHSGDKIRHFWFNTDLKNNPREAINSHKYRLNGIQSIQDDIERLQGQKGKLEKIFSMGLGCSQEQYAITYITFGDVVRDIYKNTTYLGNGESKHINDITSYELQQIREIFPDYVKGYRAWRGTPARRIRADSSLLTWARQIRRGFNLILYYPLIDTFNLLVKIQDNINTLNRLKNDIEHLPALNHTVNLAGDIGLTHTLVGVSAIE